MATFAYFMFIPITILGIIAGSYFAGLYWKGRLKMAQERIAALETELKKRTTVIPVAIQADSSVSEKSSPFWTGVKISMGIKK